MYLVITASRGPVGDMAWSGACIAILYAVEAIFIFGAYSISAGRGTGPAVRGAARATLKGRAIVRRFWRGAVAVAIAAGVVSAVDTTEICAAKRADIAPGDIATGGVGSADAILGGLVLTARGAIGQTTGSDTGSTVHLTISAGFSFFVIADAVVARAESTIFGARFTAFPCRADPISTDIGTDGAALVHRPVGAGGIPCEDAAIGIIIADAGLDGGVGATKGIVWFAARSGTEIAIRSAADAIFSGQLITGPISTIFYTDPAIGRAIGAILCGSVADAVRTTFRTGCTTLGARESDTSFVPEEFAAE